MIFSIMLSACNVEVSTPEGVTNIAVTDTSAPSLQIVDPVADAVYKTTDTDTAVSGIASDNVAVSSVTWRMASGETGTAQGTNNWIISGLPLHSGQNTITVTAHDSSDNTTDAAVVIDFTGQNSDDGSSTVVASGPCAGTYSVDFMLVEGQDTTPESTISRPVKAVPYLDPAYGTCVVRATDHETEAPEGFARNDYSRRQAFNADGTMMLIYANNGYWHVYDANTLDYIRQLSMGGSDVEPQWHPTNPELLYIFPHNGGMTIKQYNVLTDASSVVTDFRNVNSIAGHPGKTSIQEVWPGAARIWTKNEGSPSADARYWGLMVETDSFGGLGMITYDMETNTITGVYDYASDGNGIARPDHVSMSPTGDYMVGSWYSPACDSSASLGTLNNPCGLMSFSRDFSSAVGLAKLGEHSDIALDANGDDAIVMSNYDTGYVEMYSLATGAATKLWNIYVNGAATALHVSGKNYNKPGWVLISTYAVQNPQGAELWYENKIMAVEMTANPRIYNIAHTYNQTETYFSEPHAVVNRDFTRILFNSNWNTGDYMNIDAYMISLPASAIPAN